MFAYNAFIQNCGSMIKFLPNVIKLLDVIFTFYGKTGSIMKKKPPGPHGQSERQKKLQERERSNGL